MTEQGSDHVASGIFPPRPNTVYSAMRSAYIRQFLNDEPFLRFKKGDISCERHSRWLGSSYLLGEMYLNGFFYTI